MQWVFHVKEEQEILDISLSVTNKVTMRILKHKVEEHLRDKDVNLGVVLVSQEETLDLWGSMAVMAVHRQGHQGNPVQAPGPPGGHQGNPGQAPGQGSYPAAPPQQQAMPPGAPRVFGEVQIGLKIWYRPEGCQLTKLCSSCTPFLSLADKLKEHHCCSCWLIGSPKSLPTTPRKWPRQSENGRDGQFVLKNFIWFCQIH